MRRRSPTNISPKPRIDELYEGNKKVINVHGGNDRRRRPIGDITLDFKGADAREVARVILGDLLKVNFVIDTNVKGKVILMTAKPLRKEDLMAILEVILATQGAHIINYNGFYRITRVTASSTSSGGGIFVAKRAIQNGAGFRVYPLSYVATQEMAKILRPLLPKGALVHVDSKRNLLIISGNSLQHQLVSNTIEIFDINQMLSQNVLLISLQKADAETVSAELESIFGASQTKSGALGSIQLIPIARLNTVMIISKQMKFIEQARNWVYRLDRNWNPTERRLFVYYVQHGRAKNLAEALRGIIGQPNETGGYVGAIPRQSGAKSSKTPIMPGKTRQKPTPGQALAGRDSTILGKGSRISVDKDRNALLISATPKDFSLIEDVLAKLDIQPLQVMIETTIFEVNLKDTLRYGIQYAIGSGGLGITDDGEISLTRGTSTITSATGIVSSAIAPQLPGFSFTLEGASKTRFIIDALSDLTEVNMISSPNIIVLNNKVARLRVGDEVPIVTQTTTSAVTDNPIIVNSVQYRNTGVNLEVTPRVNASGMITLDIVQEVSDVVTTTTSTIDSPTIQNRSLLSTVSIKSGDTVMLGVLIREDATDAELGIPVLSSLPVIGSLFGQTSNVANRTELVVMIRPLIITSPEDTQAVTATLRRKFLSLIQREVNTIRQPRRIVKEN